jgi:chemotaxis protein histidine kinase CheA/ActR/RegA family two-component response regulator
MEQQDRILGYFLEEADQHLDTIEQGLRKLSETVRQPEMIRELFRAAHSIVGSAAMLGLTDIQQIGKQFEANFKLLKEQPIAVDNRLQSLFLESFAFLRAAIVEVKTSSDPYHRDPASLPPVGDPVFEELKAYLQNLLAQIDLPTPAPVERNLTQDPAIEQVFGEYVTRKLRELQELCLQPDRSETRAQIQQICQKLGNLGENFEFLEWTNLFAACRLATANPLNSLHQLGESIGIAVKQSQILILSDRHQAVSITPDLQALIDRKAVASLDNTDDSSTVKLNSLTDPAIDRKQDLQSLEVTSKLSSIDRELTDCDFGDNFADWMSASGAEVNSDLELEDFINLLGEDLPVEGTWMQDEDISDDTLNKSAVGNLAIEQSPISEPKHESLELVSLQPDPLPVVDIEQPIGNVDYDEETFYSPELEDADLGTFWLEADLDEKDLSAYRLQDLDSIDNSDQLQPEHPPTHDLDLAAPDFTLDAPMSDLFPANITVNESEFEETPSEMASETVESPAQPLPLNIDLQTAPMTIDLTPAPLFFEDFDSLEFPTSGEISVEAKAIESSNNSLNLQQFDDFAGLNIDSVENLDSMDSIPLGGDLDDVNLVATENLDAITDTAIHHDFIDLNLGAIDKLNSTVDPAIDAPIERLHQPDFADFSLGNVGNLDSLDPSIDSSFTDFNLQEVSELNLFAASSIDSSFDDFNLQDINELDSPVDPAIDSSFDYPDLEDNINNLELAVAPTTDSSCANFDLADSNSLELVTDLTVDSGFAQLNLENINDLDLVATPTADTSFADFNLADSNSLELVTDLTVDSGFAQLNLENINDLDLVATPTTDTSCADFNLADSNSLELVTDLTVDSGFAQLNLENINDLDLVATPTADTSCADFDLADSNSLELVTDLTVDSGFAQLNLENINDLDLVATPTADTSFADFNLADSNSLDSSFNLSYDSSIQLDRDFADLTLEMASSTDSQLFGDIELSGDISSCDLSDFELVDIGNSNSSGDIAVLQGSYANERDFADLNFDEIGGLDSGTDLSSQLGDISDLDVDLSGDRFPDLEQIVGDNSAANFNELGDLDSLLLGTAAIGVGAALLSTGGSGFDDLDALVGTSNPAAIPERGFSDLDSLLTTPKPAAEPDVSKSTKKAADRRSKQRTFEQTMRVSVRHLNNLNNLVGELVVNRNTLEQDQNRMRQFIEKLFSEVQRLNEVGKRMQDLYERSLMENSLIASRQQSKAASINPSAVNAENLDNISFMEYDPLEMDRFTPIHLLSQKMIELTVRIRESTSDIEFVVDGSTEVTRTLRQITGQLQEDLTKSRMIPFAQTADRLQRGVRENGLKYGKQVELEIEGRDTLIDKVILESLTDPLIHMVNNAIAHGIESPQTRQEFDKSPVGKISIRALHQGNQTIISVSDDGAGINTEIVKSKAIQKGIITAKQAATMTKPEVYELLFLPSFSTKDQADELAGRGVGMDVVRTSLAEIRGTISTESQVGLGSTFTIRLPLALSIAKALIAIDNKTNIAFPMDGIEDTQDVSPEQIQKNNLGENCIFWRDGLMPFKPLSDLLGFNRPLPRNNFYTQEDDTDLVSILILRSDGNLLAVQVDKITGEQEIAIKPLQGPASKPVGIAGATVMGDGRIIPIADVMELIDLAKGKITRHISTKWAMDMPAPTTQRQESMVLIVDDSITVRELLSLTFKRAGYRVEQARDGQEAWDKLRAGLPCDIVFCDIEMPRMDGLEFLSRVQKDPALSKVPVAMLTSRGSDRHRQIASQLGASGYFIKPYLEEALLHAAKRMIEGEVLAIV